MLKSYIKYLYKDVENKYRRSFYNSLEKNSSAVILDCGCWDGKNTIKYAKRISTKKIYGVEIEESKIKEAEKNKVKAKKGDLNKKFPFKDNYFDVVIANHVIEHLSNPMQFLKEMHRVLKKGGYAVIGTPNLASWHNVFALTLGIQPFSGPHPKVASTELKAVDEACSQNRYKQIFKEDFDSLRHLVIMTYKSLTGLLKEEEFKVEKSIGFGYYPFPPILSSFLEKIDKPHSHYMILKIRK